MGIKLEVGKRYVSRDTAFDVVKITHHDGTKYAPFIADDGCAYWEDGRAAASDGTWETDLIALAPDEAASSGVSEFRNSAYDGPMGVLEGYGEDDEPDQPDELATLRGRVEAAEKARDAAKLTAHLYAESVKDRDALRAENARLRELVEEAKEFAERTEDECGLLTASDAGEWLKKVAALARTGAENG